MMLKLKLQYYGHLMQSVDSLEKSLMLRGIGSRRRRGRQRMRWLDGTPTRWTWVWVNSGSWWWTGRPGVLRFMGSQRVGHDWVTELNGTEESNLQYQFLLRGVVSGLIALPFWLSLFFPRWPLSPPSPFSSLLNSVNLSGCSRLWRTLRELITG